MAEKIKPCPHCGHEVSMSSRSISRRGRRVYNVHCENPECGLGVEMDSEESALFVWNNRPSEINLQNRVDALTIETDLANKRISDLENDLQFYVGELARVRELNKNRFTRCTYCGLRIDYYAEDGGDKEIEEMNRHALVCEKDPHNIEINELKLKIIYLEWKAKLRDEQDQQAINEREAMISTLQNDLVSANEKRVWAVDQSKAYRLELKAAMERMEEMDQLFNLQHKRTVEADKRFREANKVEYFPDLGQLIEWLMDQIDRANAYIANDPRTQMIEDQAIEIENLKTKLDEAKVANG